MSNGSNRGTNRKGPECRNLRILPLLCLLAGLTGMLGAQVPGKLDLEKLDRYIEEARKQWLVPGLSIAIVKDDSVVFAKGYGVREFGKPDKVDVSTVFNVASITKSFTVSALAVLVDQGKIDWDDPVRKYLPGFTLYDPWVSDEIRIRDLLCHRSGLGTFSGDLLWFATDYTREQVLSRVRYLEPAYPFRYRYGYSNLMFLAAGEIIPSVTGKSWESFLGEKFLLPLGMRQSFFNLEGLQTNPNTASPHHVDLMESKTSVLRHLDMKNIAPAMALNSSAMDLARWIRFQLNMGSWEGKQLISQAGVWETRKVHTPRPLLMGDQRFWPSKHFWGYGLGWDLYDYHGWKVIAHEGGTHGMLSRLLIIPEENFGFVLLTNSVNAFTIGLEYYILDQYYQGKSYDWCSIYLENSMLGLKRQREDWEAFLGSAEIPPDPPRKLKEYTGIYSGDLYGDVGVDMEKGKLVLDFLPAPGMIGDLEPFSGDTFLIKLREMPFLPKGTVKFYSDEKDQVMELVIEINSPDFDFTELELKKKR